VSDMTLARASGSKALLHRLCDLAER